MRRPLSMLAAAAVALAAALVGGITASASSHSAITITTNSGFSACGCVTAGDGTAGNPYVIGPWAIAAPSGGTTGWAIKVDNSRGGITAYFNITGISANYTDTVENDPVIWLINVTHPTTISNVSANDDGTGMELDSSSNITIDDMNFNKMTGHSAYFSGVSYVNMSNSKWKATQDGVQPHNADGLYMVNSSYVNIGGVAACPKSGTCNTFDYDTGWAMYIQNSHNINIEHASAQADDTGGFIIDGSSAVDLGFTSASASGPICITLNGAKMPTGYFPSDLQGGLFLINGASSNTIHDDVFSADTGVGIGNGGNGFYLNPCTSSQQSVTPEPIMGSGNKFTNDCYVSNTAGLPPNPCK
jgi:hypothetical protein